VLRLYHALVACAAIAVGGGAAGAEERPPSFIGGAATSLEDARLVGRGGEVYARDPAGVWRRRAGGVAVELVAAWGRSPKEQLAVGPRAPVFRHDGETWTTIAGLRGRATLSVRDAPRAGLAIGAKLFVLAGATWSALPGAPAWVSALWTGAPGQSLILVEGDLYRQVPGKRPWQKVTLAEHPAALGGAEPLVLGVGGGVWKIARGRARKAKRAKRPAGIVDVTGLASEVALIDAIDFGKIILEETFRIDGSTPQPISTSPFFGAPLRFTEPIAMRSVLEPGKAYVTTERLDLSPRSRPPISL